MKGSENRAAGRTKNHIPPALFRKDLIKIGVDGEFSAYPNPTPQQPDPRAAPVCLQLISQLYFNNADIQLYLMPLCF